MESHERYSGPIVPGIRFTVPLGPEQSVVAVVRGERGMLLELSHIEGFVSEDRFRLDYRVTSVPRDILIDGWERVDAGAGLFYMCSLPDGNIRPGFPLCSRSGGAVYINQDLPGMPGACEGHAREMGVFRKDEDVFPVRRHGSDVQKPGRGWKLAPVGRTCSAEDHNRHVRRPSAVYLKADFSGIASCGSCAVRMGVFGDRDVADLRTELAQVTKRVNLAAGWATTGPSANLCQAEGCDRTIEFATNDGRCRWCCSVHARDFGVFSHTVGEPVDLQVIRPRSPVIDTGLRVTNVFEPSGRPCPCTRSLPDLCWIHVAPRKKPRPPVSRATIVGTYHARMEKLSATGRKKFEGDPNQLGRATNIDRERVPPTLTELACARVWKGYQKGPED